jgi:Xaa-Pro aminopeptidase
MLTEKPDGDPYFIDFPARIRAIQSEMQREDLDLYLGSRLRTVSWTIDAFCPWRTFVVIAREGEPVVFTFAIDAARVGDDSWLDPERVRGFAPLGGMDQIEQIGELIRELLAGRAGRAGIEDGMSNYLPEGNLTHYEVQRLRAVLPDVELVNAHNIVDRLAVIKDEGTINRFREASRIVDVGHQAVFEALQDGGYRGMTETEIAGIAAHAMRKAGSEWEWSFTGGNEIASGYRTGYAFGACTPATRREIQAGEPLMVDIHSMFRLGLGDHSHNYLVAPVTERQRWHAQNFLDITRLTLQSYRAGITPGGLAKDMLGFAEEKGFAQYMLPGFEHGIGLLGDEWRIGLNDGPVAYWTNPDHVYRENEVLICAIQYACPEEKIGFRYENPIVLTRDGCEELSKFPLAVDEVH